MTENNPISKYINIDPDTLENANNDRSASGLESYIADYHIKKYVLESKYPSWVSKMHYEGDFHVHNLTKGLLPYCFGGDLLMLLTRGMVTARITSKPAKHFDTALDHIVNFMCTNQQEWAGAQAFSHLNTLLAPFVHYDRLDYDEVKQTVQRAIFNLNFPSRSGFQTVFSNWTFDFTPSKHFREIPVIVGGEITGDSYQDFQDEMDMIHTAYWEVMNEGDGKGNILTFPIPTVNVTYGMDWDTTLMDEIIINTINRGQAFWMNYAGTGTDPDTLMALCCHLTLNMKDYERLVPAGGRWAYEGGTGSLGVVTLNLPRIGYKATSEEILFELLGELMDKSMDVLLRKQDIITESKDKMGLMPVATQYDIDFSRFFRTIGFLGLDEMIRNFTGTGIKNNIRLAASILEYMRGKTLEYQEKYRILVNLEETPAEGSSWSLALKDKKMYPDIWTRGSGTSVFYSALIPPSDEDISFIDAIKMGEELLPKLTGGTVFRVNVGEAEPSDLGMRKLVKRMAYNTKIPYYDMAATSSVCQDCSNVMRGKKDECTTCYSESIRTFARVVGYYREIGRYNPGKRAEFDTRISYNLR